MPFTSKNSKKVQKAVRKGMEKAVALLHENKKAFNRTPVTYIDSRDAYRHLFAILVMGENINSHRRLVRFCIRLTNRLKRLNFAIENSKKIMAMEKSMFHYPKLSMELEMKISRDEKIRTILKKLLKTLDKIVNE